MQIVRSVNTLVYIDYNEICIYYILKKLLE